MLFFNIFLDLFSWIRLDNPDKLNGFLRQAVPKAI